MKKLSREIYQQIRTWVYRHARHLEITKWQYYFENGSKDAVVSAISFYQNEDGGFGGGLDPDCMNPSSSPFNTINMAYDTLAELGCADKSNPIIQGIMRYIANTDHFTEHGWYWAIPSNNDYPCEDYMRFPNSPWFPDDWPAEKHTIGRMSRFVLEYFDKKDEIYKKTLRMLDYRISIMSTFAEFCKYANTVEQSIEAWDWAKVINNLRVFNIKSEDEHKRLMTEFLYLVEISVEDENIRKEIRFWQENNGDESGGLLQNKADFDALVDDLSNGRIWNKDGLRQEDRQIKIMKAGELWWSIMAVIDQLKTLKEHERLE